MGIGELGIEIEREIENAIKSNSYKPIITNDQLLAYGFKEYDVRGDEHHDRNFQYCLRDKKGIKFYVDVKYFRFSKYSSDVRLVDDSWHAHCQFDMNGAKTFNVEISVNNMTPQQIVEWFDNMHNKMGCTYYESNEEFHYFNSVDNCLQCRVFLPIPKEPYLCEACLYEQETGFRRV